MTFIYIMLGIYFIQLLIGGGENGRADRDSDKKNK